MEANFIYLDNSATTKPSDQVLESFTKASAQYFGNASSIHGIGMDADRLLRKSREQAASLLQVSPNEIVFTSGGTEGNNIAIKGIALEHQNRGKHIITSTIEHPSVLEACQGLEALGFDVTYLDVDESGLVDVSSVKAAMRDDTILVSIMHVNNEIGSVQPIKQIGEIVANYPKAFFHVDHVQGFGKLPLNLDECHIDLCTISGHKIHGLKGTGILFVKHNVKLFSLAHGGGQERKIRSGTENVAGIVALVKAMRLALESQDEVNAKLTSLKHILMEQLQSTEGIVINTPEQSAPHIINFSAPGLKPEVVIHALEEFGIYISTKSACSSKSADESAVLIACGKERAVAISGLRVSMSKETTREEIEYFSQQLQEVTEKLREVMR
ncbi:cysteine desulfurase family protein [Gracilibacillus sp. S3-1-1]|uniref:Cysteine desulfurase family protein n=1 Tax=Gracilibacillus pellucidus TaxID=3095368 RepID=A0ACC6M7A4_9BACI|nr:cysteine desulfurase family protein [Gracilibacillus sp. S3-1-1]MDX8046727.1 cysteine desulfurase family protein [Gracilibacillus sp. S3-1-1]